ncbi:sigma 54-interacting transcriptional regulator [Terrisporobacter petrolearius]|uniref:sigma-54-dependent Fis family transcriptional regulator n=1 Tax=Terrisporobacter petrolearius TaxID=1460447 RepID=UPI001D165C2B|nr:sigma 54-interacting transcriptional regulator [Terrisporobacter petrolearius]MCC3863112.1 sigma 54-interacting transcriptional regulator [Terrisporobacter petrolearius]
MDLGMMRKNWELFINHNKIDKSVQKNVAISWKKCKYNNVDPYGGRGKAVDEKVLKSIREENKWLIDIAIPIMNNLLQIVRDSHFLLVLTDSCGYIIETMGDETVNKKAKDLKLEPGQLWTDEIVGSNAIGVALDQDVAMQMAGAQHYCEVQHGWTCSATPIHGINGEIVGCIDVSGDAKDVFSHSLGIVVAAAFAIEKEIKQKHSFEIMKTALDGSSDGIILLDKFFKSIWINKSGEKILEENLNDLNSLDFRKIINDIDWDNVASWNTRKSTTFNDCKINLNDKILNCSVHVSTIITDGKVTGYSIALKKLEHLLKTVNKVTGNRATYTFDDIYFTDQNMKKIVQLAKKYARYDGCILIEGESGTGKELFAQSIHNASNRFNGPFVAVNCSSLPRDLVESELFGYEKGAFTGALKEGNPGKFELANHGTIFLDEIGEMPLEFQAKLLRIVQMHRVRRLGANYEKELDIRIIVATNRNLRLEIEKKRFRQDLYFRFNVLKLDIPPLRDRPNDICYCAEKFLNHFNERYPDQKKYMSSEFLQKLVEYNWPGNIRELQNYIERAFYLCNSQIITADDFICDSENNMSGSLINSHNRETSLDELECKNIKHILEKTNGNVELAAKSLEISRASLYRRIKKFKIDVKKIKVSQMLKQ